MGSFILLLELFISVFAGGAEAIANDAERRVSRRPAGNWWCWSRRNAR